MGFNPTFYAGRPKLSQVTIDSDLNMGGRDISGVDALQADTIGVDLIRAGRVDSPYTTETWPTETLDWGDVPGTDTEVVADSGNVGTGGSTYTLLTATEPVEVAVRVTSLPTSGTTFRTNAAVRVNEVDVFSLAGLDIGETVTTPTRILNTGDVLTVFVAAYQAHGVHAKLDLIKTGKFVGAKTFNLAGKWLALGLNMQGLAATVKIQGVEMPYSDYAKYFPLAPSELKIPGNWSPSQVRPIVKVYA